MADPEVLGTSTPTSEGERYWPALDGLRAVAVLLVVAFHCGLGAFKGGYIGVDIFFVLSGFLITTVLVEEWDRRGRIGLGRFYLRRILRLYPALLVAIVGGLIIAAWVGTGALSWIGSGAVHAVPSALSYWMNWWQMGKPFGVLGPIWSLSVEEEFYLVWPLLLIGSLYFGKRFALAATIALGGIFVVSTIILSAGWSADRLYLGTDARAPELLMGAAAALAFSINRPTLAVRRILRTAAAAGTLFLVPIAAGWFAGGGLGVPTPPYIVTLAIAASAAVIVICLTDPPNWCAAVLGSRPAIGLGRISYGVYLWHVALVYAVRELRSGIRPLFLFVVVLTACIAVAWTSYRLVEVRFLRLKRRLAP
jgi:peptidoglycan/LPS O-acetylase OafA/YrhL